MFNGFNHEEQLGALSSISSDQRVDSTFIAVPMAHQFFTVNETVHDGESIIVIDSDHDEDDMSKEAFESKRKAIHRDFRVSSQWRSHSSERTLDSYQYCETRMPRTRLSRQKAALPGFAYTNITAVPNEVTSQGECLEWSIEVENKYFVVVSHSIVRYTEKSSLKMSFVGRITNARPETVTEYSIDYYGTTDLAMERFTKIMRRTINTSAVDRVLSPNLSSYELTFTLPLSGGVVAIPLNSSDVKSLNHWINNGSTKRRHTYRNGNMSQVMSTHVEFLKNVCVATKAGMPKMLQLKSDKINVPVTGGTEETTATSNTITVYNYDDVNCIEGCFAGTTATFVPHAGRKNRESIVEISQDFADSHYSISNPDETLASVTGTDNPDKVKYSTLASHTTNELERFASMLCGIEFINQETYEKMYLSADKWYKIL